MANDENFMRALECQRLKYSFKQEGVIKPDNTNTVYIMIAFIAGGMIGSFYPGDNKITEPSHFMS